MITLAILTCIFVYLPLRLSATFCPFARPQLRGCAFHFSSFAHSEYLYSTSFTLHGA